MIRKPNPYRFSQALLALFLVVCFVLPLPGHGEDAERKLKYRVQPVYPELARKMNLEGTVKVKVQITPQGTVKDAQVLGGHPVLADAAVNAVKQWKYEPGAEATVTVEFNFHHAHD